MKRICFFLCFILAFTHIALSQEIVSTHSTKQNTMSAEDWPPTWLVGAWSVKDAQVVEDGRSEATPPRDRQDVLIFSNEFEFEVFLRNAERHRACSIAGSTISLNTVDRKGVIFCQIEYDYDGKKAKKQFKLCINGEDKTELTITYLNRRDSGAKWQYVLVLERIDDARRLKEVATSLKQFLESVPRQAPFPPNGIKNLREQHLNCLAEWTNQALNGSSVGPSTLRNGQPTELR